MGLQNGVGNRLFRRFLLCGRASCFLCQNRSRIPAIFHNICAVHQVNAAVI